MGAIATGPTGARKGRSKNEGGEIACRSCGVQNRAGARFCQDCGRSLSSDGAGRFDAQTLTMLGAAGVALLTLGLLFGSVIDMGSTTDQATTAPAPSRTAAATDGQPPDLSTMSPREAADRLFNRVMMADEQGDADEVTQFAPMAISAYDQLESLDLDALYHVGLIHAAAGDAESARDVIERLESAVPGHLLAILLDHRLAVDGNDSDKAENAIERFKASYEAEIKVDRPEYRDHQRSIDQFLEEIGGGATGGG
ncbi:MAG: DUF7577 domain-containing protein [Geminicoccaceae bacterium]